MIDRRSFLTSNVALAAALLTWPQSGAAATRTRTPAASWPPESQLAVVDRELDKAGAVAKHTRRTGVRTLEFEGDVAGLWMREIEPLLRAGPSVIAGYTGPATLFCLDLLARDFGARVRQRADARSGVVWVLSSTPLERAVLAPISSTWSRSHA